MDLLNSELFLSWVIGLIIIFSFLIPYIKSIKSKEEKTKLRLEKTRLKRQDKALLQHPIINQSLCIGCGICVESCPEGDVLGLIDGKATIIHGSHCIGHGKCAEECPIGAIEVGLGDISQREDIPQLSSNYESNISGIYIVGELSGLALIKNAISHGINAINHINKCEIKNENLDYDVIIVGTGPAGLASALRAQELGINYLIIDQDSIGGTILHYPRRKLALVQHIELPLYGKLNKGEYRKEELLLIWEKIINSQKINLQSNCKLLKIIKDENKFNVETSKGILKSKKVILALGRRGTPRKLNIPGEDLSKVMYKLIDAETYKNRKILIVGGGDSAIEAALGLAHQPGNEVTISYRKDNFFRLKSRNEKNIENAITNKLLKVIFNSSPMKIEKNSVLITLSESNIELENEFVFIFAGGELPFPLLNQIGIEFGKKIKIAV
jgi:thioredoxin reductase (NADPH)